MKKVPYKKWKTEPIPEHCSKSLSFFYETPLGRFLLKLLVNRRISKIGGWLLNTSFSSLFISPVVSGTRIPLREYEKKRYTSYNDFFTRKIRKEMRKIDHHPEAFISPCDAKLTIYPVTDKGYYLIKGVPYRVRDLLGDHPVSSEYEGGFCMIFRLTVSDYHRYCYIDDGQKGKNTFIPGVLHTVQPIAFRDHDVYRENCREYTILSTEHFGDVVQVEVGALLVGKIENRHEDYCYTRGEEKGNFAFGGSTIVLLVKKGMVMPDPAILKNTENNLETLVRMGERIGTGKQE